MKKIISLVSLLSFMLVIVKASDSAFTITGRFDEIRSGTIYLSIYGKEPVKNSAKIVNGRFIFKGFIERPTQAMLELKGDKADYVEFYIEPGIVDISGKGYPLNEVVINSPLNKEDKLLKQRLEPVTVWQNANAKVYEEAARNKNQKVLDSLDEADFEILKEKRRIVMSFVMDYPHSIRSAMSVKENYAYYAEADEVKALFDMLGEDVKNTPPGKEIETLIETYSRVAIGTIPPEITQPTPQGKLVSLSSLKGKYVLVDFWASWCGPCRRENPNVVNAYSQFKEKGLEVFSVSYDDKKEKWVKAITDDKLSWTHVSDLKGWKNATSDLYGIKAIPSNLLLDKDGRIIAKNVFGRKLLEKLAEYIK